MHDAQSPPPRKKARLHRHGFQEDSKSESSSAEWKHDRPFDCDTELLRIVTWNINGIAPFLQRPITSFFTKAKADAGVSSIANKAAPSNSASLRDILRRHGWPHILNLQEVKINPNDEGTKRSVEQAVNRVSSPLETGPSYSVHFSLPRDKYNATGFGRKVYGVVTIIRDDFLDAHVGEVREVDWDLEGRILCVDLREIPLSLWNVYAVNGTTYPYKDPSSGQIVGTRHDRKLAFHKLLVKECLALEKAGRLVVVAGDMNVARSHIDGHPRLREFPEQHKVNRADFERRFFQDEQGWQAVDTFRHLHPQERKYTWISTAAPWLSSCDRVDYTLVSRELVRRGGLIEADVLQSKLDRGPSDHVPITCSLDLARIRWSVGMQGENADSKGIVE